MDDDIKPCVAEDELADDPIESEDELDLAAADAEEAATQVEKNSRNCRVNREMRQKNRVYNLILDEF